MNWRSSNRIIGDKGLWEHEDVDIVPRDGL